jgi:hypothetical protein
MSHSTVPMTPPTPACRAASLRYSIGSGGAAAGNFYSLLIATNISGATCELMGAPSVVYLDQHGRRVGAPAALEANSPAKLLDLKPGERAAATLHQADPYNFPAAQCDAVATAGYAVTLPGDRTVTVPSVGSACAKTQVKSFWVMPFTKDFQVVGANP